MSIQQEIEKKTIIKKHVNAIHCSNNLTFVQRKLFNALLFNAYHEMPKKSQYEISIKKICQLIGYDSRDYKKIRKALMDLITTAIEWNVLTQSDELEDQKWRASTIIAAAKIENGICAYEFSSMMRELLYQPEIYGKIDLGVMSTFGSGYGLALYENCVRFQDIPQTPWFPIEVFRKLIGVSKNAYQKFGDFKKRVLDVAIKEVNTHTHIKIESEIHRSNQKVIKIRFKIINNLKIQDVDSPKLLESDLTKVLAIRFNLSSQKIEEVIATYKPENIEAKIDLILNSSSYKLGKIKNLSAYLIDALAKDYKKNKNRATSSTKETIIKAEYNIKKQQEDKEIEKRCLNIKNTVDDYIKTLSDSDYKTLLNKFGMYLKETNQSYVLKSYLKNSLNSKSTQAIFKTFVFKAITSDV